MTSIHIDGTDVVLNVEGIDRFLAFKSELRVPLAHILSVDVAGDEARGWWHGFRAPGTQLPGVITAGTFYESQGRVFWDVHDPDRAIVLHLRDDRYSKFIVEVEDPDASIASIQAAMNSAAAK